MLLGIGDKIRTLHSIESPLTCSRLIPLQVIGIAVLSPSPAQINLRELHVSRDGFQGASTALELDMAQNSVRRTAVKILFINALQRESIFQSAKACFDIMKVYLIAAIPAISKVED